MEAIVQQLLRLAASALALIFGAVILSGCTSSLGSLRPIGSAATEEYRIDSGDKIRVTVQDLKDANADYTVDDTGVISFPMIKQVTVRNKTYRDVELAIENEFRRQQILVNPKVSVQPIELRPFYILGEVGRPGEYPYRQGMTVFSAISVAGGYTYRAMAGKVEVTRLADGKRVVGFALEDTPIMPGDRIRVVEKWF
jgi:protein involved in polysaccharide export with SLBB domain